MIGVISFYAMTAHIGISMLCKFIRQHYLRQIWVLQGMRLASEGFLIQQEVCSTK